MRQRYDRRCPVRDVPTDILQTDTRQGGVKERRNMPDITKISTWELEDDLAYASFELKAHRKLQAAGLKELYHKPIEEWVEHGEKLKAIIEKELERRQDVESG